ncbi:hypothetical protein VitviT2T_030548 [Vitis vinifera]|nr:hypothetical protein VitviT2T_030548 [Vitis vinifera]
MWFLSELHNLLEINTENMPRLTILSDRQKVIVEGVEANFPTAFHGFCMRHLSDRFRKEFNNTLLVNLIWEAAQVLTVIELEAKILESEEISQEAAYWIRRIPPRLWATAYFEGTIKHSLDKQEKHIGAPFSNKRRAASLKKLLARPSTQPSFTESFSGPPFTVPSSGLTFTEPPQAPLAS